MRNPVATLYTALLPLALVFVLSIEARQTRLASPVEASGFAMLTSYDSLQTFLRRVNELPDMEVEHIATTVQGRGVSVVRVSSSPTFGSDTSKLRVLLYAQQHGDEPTGKEALTMLLAGLASGEMNDILATCDLLIVPQMNPDGAELGQRRTADSIDLNRNHALLTSPEPKGLHDLFYRWMPHVAVDIHQYGSYSSSWSDSGFIKTGDVQLGMLTNLNTSAAVRELQHEKIFPFIADRMKSRGYSFHEYIVGSPADRVRHSTTEINDGRQSFGILGTVSFIQEGRKWQTTEEQLERCVRSQLASLEGLLEYCSAHAEEITRIVNKERQRLPRLAGTRVAVRMEHRADGAVMDIPVRILDAGLDTTWRVYPYHSSVRLLTDVTMPSGYVVRREDSAVVALLRRHQIAVDTVNAAWEMVVASATVDSIGWQVLEEDSLPRVFVHWEELRRTLEKGDFMVSTWQLQSLLLCILMEPESMWGLAKYDQFAFLRGRKDYPILRIP